MPPNVAVVAVHGVADQTAHRTAQQIADLLLRCAHRSGAPKYTSFREFPMRIPVEPAQAGPKRDEGTSDDDIAFTEKLIGATSRTGRRMRRSDSRGTA